MALFILLFSVHKSNATPTNIVFQPIAYDQLQKLGIFIQPSTINPIVSADQIKQIASRYSNHISDQNTHYELVQMTNPSFKMFSQSALDRNPKLKTDGYIKDLPVWLISFQGLNIPSHGPGPIVYDHETIYVIDASTGEELYGFNYR